MKRSWFFKVALLAIFLSSSALAVVTFYEICAYGTLEQVQAAVKSMPNINEPDKEGWTPLMYAALLNDSKVVTYLIDSGAKINHEAYNGTTALYLAVYGKMLENARVLLKRGANPNIADNESISPLVLAIENTTWDMAKLLVEYGADVNSKKKLRWEIIIDVVTDDNPPLELIELMLKKGANPNAAINDSGGSLLLHAAGYNKLEVAKLLLINGADVDGIMYMTPLNVALRFGHLEMAKLLIENEAAVNTADDEGYTSLYYALEHCFYDCARELLKRGADPNDLGNGFSTWDYIFQEDYSIDKELLEISIPYGLDLNLDLRDGYTPLTESLSIGAHDLALELIEGGADPNKLDSKGNRPLALALNTFNKQPAIKLIQKGATHNFYVEYDGYAEDDFLAYLYDENFYKPKELTPLLLAIDQNEELLFLTLLAFGADPNQTASEGISPLAYAICEETKQAENGKVCSYIDNLLAKGAKLNENDLKKLKDISIPQNILTKLIKQGLDNLSLAILFSFQKTADIYSLLEESNLPLKGWDIYGRVLVLEVAKLGNQELVELLLAMGADGEEKDLMQQSLVTYLLQTKKYDQLESYFSKVKLLSGDTLTEILALDLPLKTKLWLTLASRIETKNALVKELILSGVDLSEYLPNVIPPLAYALLRNGDLELIKEMVKAGGLVNLSSKDIFLLSVKVNRHLDVIYYLNNQMDKPYPDLLVDFYICSFNSKPSLCEEVFLKLDSVKNKLNVLALAIKYNPSNETVFRLLNSLETLAIPITKDLIVMDELKEGFFQLALKSHRPLEIFTMLLEKGADLNWQDPDGNTALMLAVAQEELNLRAIKFLLEAKVNVNIRNRDGKRALDLVNPQLRGTPEFRMLYEMTD